MKSRKEIEPSDVTCVCDTREQRPFDLAPMTMIRDTLATGDYSVRGLERIISIERKSLDDLLMCVGQERERFEREIQRLLAYPTRAIVVEASWRDLENGGWRARITPSAAMGSVLGWIAQGIPMIFAGDHESGGRAASRLLFLAARRRWRELQAFGEGLKIAE